MEMVVGEVTLANNQTAVEVCMPEELVDYNHRLVVGYISQERDLTQ